MKLGLLTAAFPGRTLEEVASWAVNNGFEMLEIACWPMGRAERRYAGVTTIDVDTLTPQKAKSIRSMLEGYNLPISSLGYYPNPLHPDLDHRTSGHRSLEEGHPGRTTPRGAGGGHVCWQG